MDWEEDDDQVSGADRIVSGHGTPQRHDGTTTLRHSYGARARSPLDAETETLVTAIMDCAFTVHRTLGPGFRERIYSRAFCLELDWRHLSFESEKPIEVRYRRWSIPGQKIDLIVGGKVLVELKTVPRLQPIHRAQVVSYLKTLDLRIGLLVNFNAGVLKDGFKRVIL